MLKNDVPALTRASQLQTSFRSSIRYRIATLHGSECWRVFECSVVMRRQIRQIMMLKLNWHQAFRRHCTKESDGTCRVLLPAADWIPKGEDVSHLDPRQDAQGSGN